MRKHLPIFLITVVSLAVVAGLAVAQSRGRGRQFEVGAVQPVLTFDSPGPVSTGGRLLVQTTGPVTGDLMEQLGAYGTIHLVIDRYNLVAMTPSGPRAERSIRSLAFVTFVEKDHPRFLIDVGTWDRDILDVTDVEETGVLGNPDEREVAQTGAGVHVAVIDTGLIHRWRDFLPESRVATQLARAFMGGGRTANIGLDLDNTSNPARLWEKDTNSHGTAVASHVIGYKIGSFVVDGVAPGARVIPLKIFPNGQAFTFDSRIIAAIAFVADLKDDGEIGPAVINMSLGGGSPGVLERLAIQDAINSGVIIVASAGNSGESGMGWPGAYPEVISAGATGWTKQLLVGGVVSSSFWWLSDVDNDPDGSGTSEEQQSYVASFSSRAIPQRGTDFGIDPQELDVLAPGRFTVAPCLLPSVGAAVGNPTFCFWSGTSFSSPLTAGVAALVVEKNGSLTQADVEAIFKSTALPMNANDSRADVLEFSGSFVTHSWDTACGGLDCDPVGSGLLQADGALAAVP